MSQILLNNCDPDDVSDVMVQVVESLDIKFVKGESLVLKTFGQFCDEIYARLPKNEVSDCTTQQAFHKLRNGVCGLRNLNAADVVPDSLWEELVPRKGRRKLIKQLKQSIGVPISLLTPKGWILGTLGLAPLGAVVELIFNWRYGFAGLGVTILAFKIADALGKEFKYATFGEAAKEMAFSHYMKSRRDPGSINRQEVETLIRKHFCDWLVVKPEVLTREALF